MITALNGDDFWINKISFNNAEREYYESLSKVKDKSKQVITNNLNMFSNMITALAIDIFWINKISYNNAECKYYEKLSKEAACNEQCNLVSEIAKAREHIKHSLEKMDGISTISSAPSSMELIERISSVERENADLRILINEMQAMFINSQSRILDLEKRISK